MCYHLHHLGPHQTFTKVILTKKQDLQKLPKRVCLYTLTNKKVRASLVPVHRINVRCNMSMYDKHGAFVNAALMASNDPFLMFLICYIETGSFSLEV